MYIWAGWNVVLILIHDTTLLILVALFNYRLVSYDTYIIKVTTLHASKRYKKVAIVLQFGEEALLGERREIR